MFQQALMHGKQSQFGWNMEQVFDSSSQESDITLLQFLFQNQQNPIEDLLCFPEVTDSETQTQDACVIDKENECARSSSPFADKMLKI